MTDLRSSGHVRLLTTFIDTLIDILIAISQGDGAVIYLVNIFGYLVYSLFSPSVCLM